jgi:integrating conjugative element relaxase (TIGR03760 family)
MAKPLPLTDLTAIANSSALLALNKRQTLVDDIKTHMSWPKSEFDQFAQPVLDHFFNYCQQLPESQISFYGHPGGLLDYSLNRCEAAMAIFRGYLIPDDQGGYSEIQRLWQYALYSAALLKGIGKLWLDFTVKVYDDNGHFLSDWNPLCESLASKGSHYQYHFVKNTDDDFRRRLNLFIARQIMPVSGFNWIASNAEVLAAWLALLHEDPYRAGTLGLVLINSDAIAIKRYLHRLTLGGAAAGTGGRTFNRLASFSHKSKNSLIKAEQEVGVAFIEWMVQSIESGKLMINKAPLMMVPGGLIMHSDMFKYFIRENPHFKNWQAIEMGLLNLGLHQVGPNGKTNQRFELNNGQSIIDGIVIKDYAVLLPEKAHVMNPNTGETYQLSSTELINQAHNLAYYEKMGAAPTVAQVQALNSKGNWQQASLEAISLKPDLVHRG